MTQPLNLCRRLARLLQANDETSESPAHAALSRDDPLRLEMLRSASKFTLPHGGFASESLGPSIVQDVTECRLPFPAVVLEWAGEIDGEPRHFVLCAQECDGSDEIDLWAAHSAPGGLNAWAMSPLTKMSRLVSSRYEARTEDVCMRLLAFLTVLQCSNVHLEPPPQRSARKAKTALPFDSYWTLTIDAASKDARKSLGGMTIAGLRTPREHLRRGHIVRPDGRRPYWRNATVVCAGRGAGNVFKDYRVREAA